MKARSLLPCRPLRIIANIRRRCSRYLYLIILIINHGIVISSIRQRQSCQITGQSDRDRSIAVSRIKDDAGKHPNCSHCLYLLWFGGAHAKRSADLKIECQAHQCSHLSQKWTIFEFVFGLDYHATKQWISIPTIEANMNNCPVQFFSNNGREYRKEHALLSIKTVSGLYDRKSNSYCAELRSDEYMTNENNSAALERIVQSLHPFQ